MSISSIYDTDSISAYYRLLQAEQTKTDSKTGKADENETVSDIFSLSDEAVRQSKMPPPPEAMDFENMSDDEFKSYLEQSLSVFGQLPGIDNVSSVDDLTEEQLAQLRETFTEMSQNPPVGPGGGPPPLSQVIEDADDDDLKYILANLLEKTGGISGLEDDEATSVDDLTQEQLEKAKRALIEETKRQEEEMLQRQMLYNPVISAYEKNLAFAGVSEEE